MSGEGEAAGGGGAGAGRKGGEGGGTQLLPERGSLKINMGLFSKKSEGIQLQEFVNSPNSSFFLSFPAPPHFACCSL